MLLSFLRELGIDTSREFTLNGTKCIVKNGEIQESGNKWVVPSSVHNKALQRYEEWLSQPLSAHIYNSQTGKLSSKDGSTDEFVDYFNGTLSGESSESLNGYNDLEKHNIERLIDLNGSWGRNWFQPDKDEYEITCEIVNGEESSYSVNGKKS